MDFIQQDIEQKTRLVEEPADTSCPPQIVNDRYELIELIGKGGMGKVYKARHIRLDKIVALKLLSLHDEDSDRHLQRFEQEAKAASSLAHPNLVAVTDYGMVDDVRPYLVMDYVEGETLQQVIQRNGHLRAEDALPIFKQICDGLSYAHENGVVHRDLKPSNVLIVQTADGPKVRIADFGLAKVMTKEQRLTATGDVFGSPFYMSPEQQLGHPVDARSDIYSLGCLMFEVLTGDVPFKGDNMMQTFLKHLHDEVPPFPPACGIPDQLERIIAKALEKSADKRQQTITQLRAELDGFTAGGASGTKHRQANARKWPLKHLSIGLVLSLAALGAFAFWLTSTDSGATTFADWKVAVNHTRTASAAEELMAEGERAMDKSQFAAAQKYFQGAWSIVDGFERKDVPLRGELIYRVGKLEAAQSHTDKRSIDEATFAYLESELVKTRQIDAGRKWWLTTMGVMGRHALDLGKELYGERSVKLLPVLRVVAEVDADSNQARAALEALQQCLQICKDNPRSVDQYQFASFYGLIGHCYARLNVHEQARQYYEDALKHYGSYCKPDARFHGMLLFHLALNSRELRQAQRAEQFFKDSLALHKDPGIERAYSDFLAATGPTLKQ